MRTLLIAGLLIAGCQREVDSSPPPEVKVAEPAKVPAVAPENEEAKEPAAAEPAAAAEKTLAVAAEDRGCVKDDECTAILTQCSMCQGACTGVRSDRAAGYAGKLDCSQYRGMVCNYDCRPRFKIEAPRCVNGRCESVRIVP